ncbi:MFS transporter [Photorhabdus hindustanensis]|uniref:MFS transporter n=1 Tax=Photorhabdus hindustanensis TaxID=2918802 RepID=UPI0011B0058B|nr:MFS transporter [Photorhabdus hindustanensis]
MENKNKLLSSDIISIFGTGISEIALLSLVYSITKSEIDTSLMVSVRLMASILVFVVIGGLTARFNMRAICISSDLFRAVTIFLAVFVNNIYLLFFISFLLSFFSGLNISIRSAAYQVFVSSEERVAFISKQQFYYGLLSISSPLIAGFLINMMSIRSLFLIESMCFILSIIFLFFISDWGTKIKEKDISMKYGGLEYIIKNNTQRNILLFRISILTAMVSYQVISTYIMTSNYTTIVSLFSGLYSFSFSDLVAYFSFLASISMLFGSYLSGCYFNISKLKKIFLSWLSFDCCWIYFLGHAFVKNCPIILYIRHYAYFCRTLFFKDISLYIRARADARKIFCENNIVFGCNFKKLPVRLWYYNNMVNPFARK